MTTSSAKIIVHSVICVKLDHCNCLLVGIPDYVITKLQHAQNAAARIVVNLKKYDSVTPYVMKLHWLAVRQHIIHKLNLIVFKALKGHAPDNIQSLLSINQLPRLLSSGDKMYKEKEHQWKLRSKGYQSFHVAAPCYWNSLRDDVRNIELDLNDFKKKLKFFYLRVFLLEWHSD